MRCSMLFFSFFAAAFLGQTIRRLAVRSAKKRPFHTLQKTIRDQIVQIFSFSQMISRIIYPLFHFYQNLLLHEFLSGFPQLNNHCERSNQLQPENGHGIRTKIMATAELLKMSDKKARQEHWYAYGMTWVWIILCVGYSATAIVLKLLGVWNW